MKFKSLVLSLLLVVVTLGTVGCTSSDDVKVVTDAITKYENSKDVKVVYCYINSGNQSSMSVEVKDGDNHYSEMPYTPSDTESEKSTEATEVDGASNQQYLLYDWIKKDGTAYTLNSAYNEESDDSKLWIEMPKGYGESVWARANLYARDMLDESTLKKADKEKVNLGSGDVEVQTYECEIKEDKIKEILEKETTNLIKLEQEEIKNKDKNSKKDKVDKFLKDTIDGYESTSAYADGKVIYGIKDKELVYVRLETGGLGTAYSLERVVLNQEVQVRDEPTFKDNTSSYYDLVLSYVEYKEKLNEDAESTDEGSEESSEATEQPTTGGDATATPEATITPEATATPEATEETTK